MMLQLVFGLGEQATSSAFVTDIFFSFLKVLFIIAGLLYVAFAVVVVRQVFVMQETLVTSLSGILKLLAFAHLFLSVMVLIYFLLVL